MVIVLYIAVVNHSVGDGIGERSTTDTARHMVVAYGPVGLSLREVARQTDYSPATLYEYFDSREALLTALMHEGFDELKQAFVSVPAALPPRERLAALGLAYIEFARQQPETFALLFTQHTTRHTQLSEVQHGENFYAVFRAAVVAILAKAPARQIERDLQLLGLGARPGDVTDHFFAAF